MNDLINRYVSAVTSGNRAEAQEVIRDAQSIFNTPASLICELIIPSQHQVGELWHGGKISIAQEGRATAITRELIMQVRSSAPRATPHLKRAVIAILDGEEHSLAAQFLADLFWLDGWEVTPVLSPLPNSQLKELLRIEAADLLLVSVTNRKCTKRLEELLIELKEWGTSPKVIAGGSGIIKKLNGCHVANSFQEGLSLGRSLTGLPPKNPSLDSVLERMGQKLIALRKAGMLSQEELAKKAGVERTYLSAVERGRQNLTVAALVKLSEALKVPVAELFH